MEITITGITEAMEGARRATLIGVISGMEKIGDRGVGLVVEGTPAGATGQLAKTVFPHLEQSADMVSEIIANGPPADVYAAPVNDGSCPHFPPYEALIPWVIKKFGIMDEKTARSAAFLVARKISRSGTPPWLQYDRAFDALYQEVEGILKREIAQALLEAGF